MPEASTGKGTVVNPAALLEVAASTGPAAKNSHR
jgi:hypothetical protein